jgi:hypothetical protein
MPTFNLDPNKSGQNDINFAHPSSNKLKQILPTITVDPSTGYILVSKKTKVSIKASKISNSTSLSKNVMIDKLQIVDPQFLLSNRINISSFTAREAPNTRVGTPPDELPSINQNGGICQTMPFLHTIQSQLDYPMDYNFLWKCASSLPNPVNLFGVLGDTVTNTVSFGTGTSYNKLTNILYGDGRCISTQKICPEDVKVQEVGISSDSSDCDNPCNQGIKITTRILPPPSTEQELRDRLNNFGPMAIGCRGLTVRRLSAMARLTIRDDTPPKWEDLKNLDHDGLDAILEENTSTISRAGWLLAGHAVTITAAKDGQFVVKNSFGDVPDCIMSYDELKRDFEVYDSIFNLDARLNYAHLYPEVTKCPGISSLAECIQAKCIDRGYDKVKDPPSDKCECECDEVTPSGSCTNAGSPVQKVYNPITRKCECPRPLSYFTYYEGDDCCLKEKPLQWCEELFCYKTSDFYVVNIGVGGRSELEAVGKVPGVLTRDVNIVRPESPPPSCPITTLPPECSGVYREYTEARQAIVAQFNIVNINEIKIL